MSSPTWVYKLYKTERVLVCSVGTTDKSEVLVTNAIRTTKADYCRFPCVEMKRIWQRTFPTRLILRNLYSYYVCTQEGKKPVNKSASIVFVIVIHLFRQMCGALGYRVLIIDCDYWLLNSRIGLVQQSWRHADGGHFHHPRRGFGWVPARHRR